MFEFITFPKVFIFLSSDGSLLISDYNIGRYRRNLELLHIITDCVIEKHIDEDNNKYYFIAGYKNRKFPYYAYSRNRQTKEWYQNLNSIVCDYEKYRKVRLKFQLKFPFIRLEEYYEPRYCKLDEYITKLLDDFYFTYIGRISYILYSNFDIKPVSVYKKINDTKMIIDENIIIN